MDGRFAHVIEIRHACKYRLYRCDKRDNHLHRQINIAEGEIKAITVKRDAAKGLWLFLSVVEQMPESSKVTTCRVAGFGFGLKTFLTDHIGKADVSGLYHRQALQRLQGLKSCKDKKPPGTNNRKNAAKLISRTHIRVVDKRRDADFKLAYKLCDQYDLRHMAANRGKTVVRIGHFVRTMGKCSGCGHPQALELCERTFHCDSCGLTLDRDQNAAINIC